MIEAEECRTMAEVRAGVDRVDEQIVELLARRFRFMEAAARIKQSRDTVRDERRKGEVIAHVREAADAARIPADLVATLYDQLIEGSIAYELELFDAMRG